MLDRLEQRSRLMCDVGPKAPLPPDLSHLATRNASWRDASGVASRFAYKHPMEQ